MRRIVLAAVLGAALSMISSAASGSDDRSSGQQGRIAYSSRYWPTNPSHVDNWEIFVRRLGGLGANLTRNPRCSEMFPSWSRSGRWLAFACGYGPPAGIYVLRGDGTGRRAVIRLPNRRPEGVAWSPDERRIAFGDRDRGGIWVVNASGSGVRRLTRAPDSSPTWSRNGQLIAFYRDARRSGVWLMRANGAGQRRIATDASTPAWSPDGRTIAFLRKNAIWLMNPDGLRQRRLPGSKNFSTTNVAWAPDSQYLAWEEYSPGGIFITPVNGPSSRRVASPLEPKGLSWGPP